MDAKDSAGGQRLRITEIFFSLQGETSQTGLPTIFVRLTGCPLRCVYCDTAYAFNGGRWMEFSEIFDVLRQHPSRRVTVTGGEPLAQPACVDLLRELCDQDYHVSLETSGAIDISTVDPRVIRVVDVKTPASGEESRNKYENLSILNPQDQIKFVLADRQDYEWCRQTMARYALNDQCEVLLSPVHDQLPARQLAEWILQDGLDVRMQIQLHKFLWGNEQGR